MHDAARVSSSSTPLGMADHDADATFHKHDVTFLRMPYTWRLGKLRDTWITDLVLIFSGRHRMEMCLNKLG